MAAPIPNTLIHYANMIYCRTQCTDEYIKRTLCLSPETSAERDQSFRLQCINMQNGGNKGNFISIFNISLDSERLKQGGFASDHISPHDFISYLANVISTCLLYNLI